MDLNKLAPWNWFKKEDEMKGNNLPIRRNRVDDFLPTTIERFHQDMNRLFEQFFRSFNFPETSSLLPTTTWAPENWWRPNLDISSNDKEYSVQVELPGVSDKDVQVEVSGDTLRISGEKKQEKEDKGKNYYSMERSFGTFQRILTLPEDADSDNIAATFQNGIMKITIPRKETEKSKTKRITVNPS